MLVFALSPLEEVNRKTFLNHGDLAKSLSKHIRKVATNSGLPVLYFDESKQQGRDFGSRFTNALQSAYDKGYDSVITIGSDSPQLSKDHIVQAQKALENNGTVLGPTHDGGFYLLGLSKEHFKSDSFLNFSWNTEAVFEDVYNNFLNNNYQCTILQKLRDIDYFSDFEKLPLQCLTNVELREIIRVLISKPLKKYYNSGIKNLEVIQSVFHNKGSPFLSAL